MKKAILACLSVLLLAQCRDGAKNPGAPPVSEAPLAESRTELARSLALETQAILGATLQARIRDQGAVAAIGFCNLRALPITDSVSQAHGANIQRITNRPRNHENRASGPEVGLMTRVNDSLTKGADPGPLELFADGDTNFYFPILTNNLCLQCHGVPIQDVAPDVQSKIALLYPGDMAMGYGPNQLRGLWKVTLASEHE